MNPLEFALRLDWLLDPDRPPLPPAAPPADPTPAGLPPTWHVLWDERAAIMEYDGGLPRERAEHLALLEVLAAMRPPVGTSAPPAP